MVWVLFFLSENPPFSLGQEKLVPILTHFFDTFSLPLKKKVFQKEFLLFIFLLRNLGVSLHWMMVLDLVVRLRGKTVRFGYSTRCCVPVIVLNQLKATELHNFSGRRLGIRKVRIPAVLP